MMYIRAVFSPQKDCFVSMNGPHSLCVLAGGGTGLDSEQDPRLLSSREFLRELGKGAGARKELSALSLRWINLRGLPHITAAFTYNK